MDLSSRCQRRLQGEEGSAGGGRRGGILVMASEAGILFYDGRQQLDICLSNPQCIFLFIVLAILMLMILIHSASILPLLHPFVRINPANKFRHLASN